MNPLSRALADATEKLRKSSDKMIFGVCAGKLTPTFFAHFIPWNDVEPMGFACVLGATGGLFLGGGLAVFSLLLHLALRFASRAKS